MPIGWIRDGETIGRVLAVHHKPEPELFVGNGYRRPCHSNTENLDVQSGQSLRSASMGSTISSPGLNVRIYGSAGNYQPYAPVSSNVLDGLLVLVVELGHQTR